MMKLVLVIFLIEILANFVVRSEELGYYWKDYYGEIPDDAFPGGTDVNGDPIYIGQVLYDTCLVPSKIYGSTKKVYFEMNSNEREATNQVKILCTQHPEQLEWIQTDNEKIKVITDQHLIIGGYQRGSTTYIGRGRSNGEILVGKVLADYIFLFTGLWSTSSGKSIRFTTFDVLSFNKNAPLIRDRYGI